MTEIQELSLNQKASSAKFLTLFYTYRRWLLTLAGKIVKRTRTRTRRRQDWLVFVCLAVWLAGCHFPAQPLLALPHIQHHCRRIGRRTTTARYGKHQLAHHVGAMKTNGQQQFLHLTLWHLGRCSRRRTSKEIRSKGNMNSTMCAIESRIMRTLFEQGITITLNTRGQKGLLTNERLKGRSRQDLDIWRDTLCSWPHDRLTALT